jgi:hypothetical protein
MRLYVGQPAFAFGGDAGVTWGRIRELRVDDVSTTTVEATSPAEEVGVSVSFRCPKRPELYVLESDNDDVVWSPES